MAEYIEKEAVIMALEKHWNGMVLDVFDFILNLPSADVQPVRHGHLVGLWYDGYANGNPVYEEWECSECGSVYEGEDIDFKYCPNCGVRFEEDGEQNETD